MLYEKSWEDGTPKSSGNAFDIPKSAPVLTAAEKQNLRNRKSWDQKLEKQGRTRADAAKNMATRVNKNIDLSAHCGLTNSIKSSR